MSTRCPESFVGGRQGLHLWLRMLSSCRVDADFPDTEAFMQPDRARQCSACPEPAVLLAPFCRFMDAMIAGAGG